MRVTRRPATDQYRLQIGLVIAVGILQVQCFRRVLHNRTTSVDHDRCGNRETFRENRELVGHVVTVGVFTDTDAVAISAKLIRVVERFTDPQSTAFVPVHSDGLRFEAALVSVESQCHAFRKGIVLHRFLDGQRQLHRCLRSSLNPPVAAGGVVGNLWSDIDKFKRSDIGTWFRHFWCGECFKIRIRRYYGNVFPTSPADSAFHQITKARIRPGPCIMSPRRVKDPAFALSPDPGPRFPVVSFSLFAFHTVFQDCAVFFVVQVMNVGFVPTRKTAEALHDGMREFGYLGAKHLSAMPLELPAHELHDFRIVPPAVRGTVERNESFAARNIIQHSLRLSVFDPVDVGIQHQPIEAVQRVGREVFHAIRVLQLNPPLFQHRRKLMKHINWPMMPIVAHEEQFQISGVCVASDRTTGE